MRIQSFLVFFFLTAIQICIAQTPFYRNYSPEEYSASTQNWAVVQDQSGIMYFGNTDGVLEYDGTQWHLIKTMATVRSLAIHPTTGRIYVGTVNDFGYLKPDEKGVMQYQSIADKIPEDKRGFNAVWRTRVINDEVFYCAFERIFRYKNDKITVYEPKDRFTFSFKVYDDLFVHEQGKGIIRYNGDNFELLPNTETFADSRVYVMLPYEEDKLLIATQTYGISIYSLSKQKIIPQPEGKFTEVNDFLIKRKTYSGIVLPDGNIAIGTVTYGMLVFTPEGEIIDYYNKTNGLQDNSVYMLELDNTGLLWATLNHGISTINLKLPFETYTELDGLSGTVFALETFRDELYIGTSQKLYKQKADKTIEDIAGTEIQNWFLKSAKDQLLLAHNPRGLLKVENNQAIPIKNGDGMSGVVFCEIDDKPNYMLAGGGMGYGLAILHFENGNWVLKKAIEEFEKSIYALNFDNKGNLWAYCSPDLYKLRLNEDLDKLLFQEKMTTEEYDLKIGHVIPYRMNDGSILFGSDMGVYEYSEEKNEFTKFPMMQDLTGDVSPIMQDKNGNIWYEESKNGKHYKGVYLKSENWRHERTPFYKFSNAEIYKGPTSTIYENEEGNIIFGSSKGIICYDPKKEVNYDQDFATIIKNIYVNDTLLISKLKTGNKKYYLSYEENNLKFDFASLFFEDNDKTQYAYRLNGRDNIWSDFTSLTSKEYTNLDEGLYSFELKSINLYQKEGKTAVFSFEIAPPWYRTLWAYLSYLLLGAMIIAGVSRFNSKRLRRRNEILEKIVEERTAELSSEKEKSEQLLLNILPKETADEIKETGKASTRRYESVSVLFTDFKGFSQIAENTSPSLLVKELDYCFKHFDEITERHGIEKIKTIGDGYMAAAGVPTPCKDSADRCISAAKEILAFMESFNTKKRKKLLTPWELRVGIHTGPLVTGVVGKNKMAYDIWGDTVNLACRMETAGIPGKINISGEVKSSCQNPDNFTFEYRGKIKVKHHKRYDMFIVS